MNSTSPKPSATAALIGIYGCDGNRSPAKSRQFGSAKHGRSTLRFNKSESYPTIAPNTQIRFPSTHAEITSASISVVPAIVLDFESFTSIRRKFGTQTNAREWITMGAKVRSRLPTQ